MPYKDPEKRRDCKRRWRAANLEKVKERDRIRNASATTLSRKRAYRAADLEKARGRDHLRYISDKKVRERLAKSQIRRRAQLKASALDNFPTDWKTILREIQGNRCAYCRCLDPDTIDHVVPLSKGGEHSWENVVLACRSCNSRKGTKLLGLE